MSFGKDDAFPLQGWFFEIDDKAELKAGDAKVVDHLATLMIRDFFDGLGVDDNASERDQIRDEFANKRFPPNDWKTLLLFERDAAMHEFHGKSVFIRFLIQSVTNSIQNGHGASNDLIDLILKNQIRGHSRQFAVEVFFPFSISAANSSKK
jgi:hypothetical protein